VPLVRRTASRPSYEAPGREGSDGPPAAEVDRGDGAVERAGYPHGTGRNGDAGGAAADPDWQAGVAKARCWMFDVGWAIAGARRCELRR
jgi:hypothetical protein